MAGQFAASCARWQQFPQQFRADQPGSCWEECRWQEQECFSRQQAGRASLDRSESGPYVPSPIERAIRIAAMRFPALPNAAIARFIANQSQRTN